MSVIVVENKNVKGNMKRFVVVDSETGEILDNAQGYGYKTARNAHRAWAYKNRDKSKDLEKKQRQEEAIAWLRKHKGFCEAMDQFCFEIEVKKSWGEDDKFDSKFVKWMLKQYDLKTEFKPSEILKAWEKCSG